MSFYVCVDPTVLIRIGSNLSQLETMSEGVRGDKTSHLYIWEGLIKPFNWLWLWVQWHPFNFGAKRTNIVWFHKHLVEVHWQRWAATLCLLMIWNSPAYTISLLHLPNDPNGLLLGHKVLHCPNSFKFQPWTMGIRKDKLGVEASAKSDTLQSEQ